MAMSAISASYMAAPPSLSAARHQSVRAQPSSLQLQRRDFAIARAAQEASQPSPLRRFTIPSIVEKVQKFSSFAALLEKSEKPLLVEFYTTWCVPCQILGDNLVSAARLQFDSVQVVRIDIDKNRGLASKFGIKVVPTCILFKDGKPVDRFEGIRTVEHYVLRIQRALRMKTKIKR